ncbi:hypothetical protein PENTCL1PPCAC_29100 [Pristionchus entomophagus]|uniref:Uncharacterized protein n=1 Tax=Pristionchus entomophagus TaxID=358040 RepID=A0AAV5UIN8_9BILA|nr:hypothetical protein PENTCL1PPCAC_29100 [Pristionchus entomophagus]
MTGSDRKALLVPLFASPHFECVVLLDGQGTISAWAGITSVGFPEESLFKLAPPEYLRFMPLRCPNSQRSPFSFFRSSLHRCTYRYHHNHGNCGRARVGMKSRVAITTGEKWNAVSSSWFPLRQPIVHRAGDAIL